MEKGIVEEDLRSIYCDVKLNVAKCPRTQSSDACEVSPAEAGLDAL